MKLSTFILCTTLGAGAWNTFLAMIGHIFGKTMSEADLIAKVKEYSNDIKYGIAVTVIIGFAYYIYKVIKANREASARNNE